MKRSLLVATAALVAAVVVVPNAATAKPKLLWEDPTGDIGFPAPEVPMGQAGLDLTGGSVEKVDDTLEFTVTHSAMPPIGSFPEMFRFLWAFSVDGTTYRFTVKRADVGKPDVVQQQTTERVGRVDVMGHFRLEGDCATEATPAFNAINCKPLGYLEGRWDPATQSFTVVLPLEAVDAKPGSMVTIGSGDAIAICAICWVSHAAERSLDTTIVDTATWAGKYKIPKK